MSAHADRAAAPREPSPTGLPPGPSTPGIFQTAQFAMRPFDFLERCARRYGDCFTVRSFGRATVVVSHPDAVKDIFSADTEVLTAGESNAPFLGPILGWNSVLVLDGAKHLRERRLMLPPLHGERMQAYALTMRDVTDRVVDAWPLGRPFEIHPSMQRITLEVIIRTVFGLDAGPTVARLYERISDMLSGAGLVSALCLAVPALRFELGGFSPWGVFRRFRAEFDGILLEAIAERRRGGSAERTDILSMLLEARDEDGKPMSDGELLDEMFTLLMAGHETTAAGLAWAFHHVLADAEVLARLRAELDTVTAGTCLEPAHLPRLTYLDAVVKESLRLFPVIPSVVREVKVPTRIGGRELPVGINVSPAIYLTHRRPDIWTDPTRFHPERFVNARTNPYAFLPFGGGMRRCLGAAFATYEMKVVLAEVLLRAELRVAPGYRLVPKTRGFAVAPSQGMPVVVDRRQATPGAAVPR